MKIRLHKQARTTPAIRAEIRESTLSERVLAEKYNISRSTVRKWKKRQSVEDNSHRPHTIHTAFSSAEELLAMGLRRFLVLPLDDLLLVMQVFFQANISRSALDRCLRRHGISRLSPLLHCGRTTGKTNVPGVLHVGLVDLSFVLKATQKRMLYIAVDRASRFLYAEIRSPHTATSFLRNLLARIPFPVTEVHTAISPEFTARLTTTPECALEQDRHPFSMLCRRNKLSHQMHDGDQMALFSADCTVPLGAQNPTQHRWSLAESRQFLSDFCSFFNTEFPLICCGRRPPMATIQNWLSTQKFSATDATWSPQSEMSMEHANAHRRVEEEELAQLRHANRRLRLEQALLVREQRIRSNNT